MCEPDRACLCSVEARCNRTHKNLGPQRPPVRRLLYVGCAGAHCGRDDDEQVLPQRCPSRAPGHPGGGRAGDVLPRRLRRRTGDVFFFFHC